MSMANASSVIKRGIAPLAMGLNNITLGSSLTSDCYGGTYAACSVVNEHYYFNVGDPCMALGDITLSSPATVEMRWIDANGNVVSSNSWNLGAGSSRFGAGWNNIPSSLIGGPSPTPAPKVSVFVNGAWAGDRSFVVTQGTKSVKIAVDVKNTGNVSDNLILGYAIDSQNWVGNTPFTLGAGQSTTINFTNTATTGSHTLYTRLWLSDMTVMDTKTQTFTV